MASRSVKRKIDKPKIAKRTVAPAIDESVFRWYGERFKTPNMGCRYMLEAFPGFFDKTLLEINRSGRFTFEDCRFLLYAFRHFLILPSTNAMLAGHSLAIVAQNALSLSAYPPEMQVSRGIVSRVRELSIFQAACVEVWAQTFWLHFLRGKTDSDVDDAIRTYCRNSLLCSNPDNPAGEA